MQIKQINMYEVKDLWEYLKSHKNLMKHKK